MPFGPWLGRSLISAADDAALVEALRAAERGSRGEIRVHLERRGRAADPLERAREVFFDLGMDETAEGTGVLLYVSLKPRVACVYAGEGVHAAGGDAFWDEVVDEIARGFAEGRARDGLVRAIERIGALLRRVVPGDDRAGNELPEEVSRT